MSLFLHQGGDVVRCIFDSHYRSNMRSPLEGLYLEMNEDGLN